MGFLGEELEDVQEYLSLSGLEQLFTMILLSLMGDSLLPIVLPCCFVLTRQLAFLIEVLFIVLLLETAVMILFLIPLLFAFEAVVLGHTSFL